MKHERILCCYITLSHSRIEISHKKIGNVDLKLYMLLSFYISCYIFRMQNDNDNSSVNEFSFSIIQVINFRWENAIFENIRLIIILFPLLWESTPYMLCYLLETIMLKNVHHFIQMNKSKAMSVIKQWWSSFRWLRYINTITHNILLLHWSPNLKQKEEKYFWVLKTFNLENHILLQFLIILKSCYSCDHPKYQ